jgi:hypothetical protein
MLADVNATELVRVVPGDLSVIVGRAITVSIFLAGYVMSHVRCSNREFPKLTLPRQLPLRIFCRAARAFRVGGHVSH